MIENNFNNRIKLSPGILRKIAKIDEFKGLWHGSLRLSPQILGRLKSSVIITSTGASTRIEGSKMSDENVARLLRGLKSNPPKNRAEQEVIVPPDDMFIVALAGRARWTVRRSMTVVIEVVPISHELRDAGYHVVHAFDRDIAPA